MASTKDPRPTGKPAAQTTREQNKAKGISTHPVPKPDVKKPLFTDWASI